MRQRQLSVAALALVLAGCGPDPQDAFTDAPPAGDPDAALPGDAAAPADVLPIPDAGPPPFFGRVYAHSASELYGIDPETLDVSLIGSFTFPDFPFGDSITDIALDKDANMVGISYTEVYAIDKTTAVCTHLSTLEEGQY